jgi:hypothetical protein
MMKTYLMLRSLKAVHMLCVGIVAGQSIIGWAVRAAEPGLSAPDLTNVALTVVC